MMDPRNFNKKRTRIASAFNRLQSEKIKKNQIRITLKDLLKKPEIRFKDVLEYTKFAPALKDEDIRHIEAEIKYEGYLKKQAKEIRRILKSGREKIPENIPYDKIPGLTREVVELLEKAQPLTIGEAAALKGMTPAAVTNIQVYIAVGSRKKRQERDRKNGECST